MIEYDHMIDVGTATLDKKDFLMFVGGMVVQKIAKLGDWKVWAAVIGALAVLVSPTVTTLVVVAGTIDREVQQQMAPVIIRVAHLEKFATYGERFSADDAHNMEIELHDDMAKYHDADRKEMDHLQLRILRLEDNLISGGSKGVRK